MHLPLLPLQHMSIDLEADAFGLHDMQRLDVISELEALLLSQQIRKEVIRLLRRRNALPVCGLTSVRLEVRWCRRVNSELDINARRIKERIRLLLLVRRREVDVHDFLGNRVYDWDEVLAVDGVSYVAGNAVTETY